MYDHILVPMGWDAHDEIIIEHVTSLAQMSGGQVTLLRVVHSHSRDEAAYLAGRAQKYIDESAARLSAKGISTDTKIVTDEPAPGIIFAAREIGADLIVMATHGHSEVRHLFVGSVTEDVIRGSETPVLLIRPPEAE
jgi:nucleotide-binding universal stress UspA family protein